MYAYNIHDMYGYTDQLNLQFSNLTIQLDVHIGYYTGALTTQDHFIYRVKIRRWIGCKVCMQLLGSKFSIWIVNKDYLETRTSVKERMVITNIPERK